MPIPIVENAVMQGLIYLVSLFDPYGIDHHKRVADHAVKLAARCGADAALIETIRKAAMIHDIGKMGVPEYIRRMSGRYLPAERDQMETHVMHGYNYLEHIVDGVISEDAALIVKHHHQDWGGPGGYPDPRLKGNDIPFGARILRPCDWYDAVTHERGYKRASTKKEALEEMVDIQIEHQPFDPDILRAFLEMILEQ